MSTKVTTFALVKTKYVLDIGEMAEWSIAAVLKTVEGHTSGGSNPSLSAERWNGSQKMASIFCSQAGHSKKGLPAGSPFGKCDVILLRVILLQVLSLGCQL